MLSKLWLRDVGSMLPCQSSCAAHACAPHWVMIRASRVRGQALRMTAAGAALGWALRRHSLAVHMFFYTPSLWGCTVKLTHVCPPCMPRLSLHRLPCRQSLPRAGDRQMTCQALLPVCQPSTGFVTPRVRGWASSVLTGLSCCLSQRASCSTRTVIGSGKGKRFSAYSGEVIPTANSRNDGGGASGPR